MAADFGASTCPTDAAHMFALAEQAATAIGETVAAGNPKGAADTGIGAMAAFAGG